MWACADILLAGGTVDHVCPAELGSLLGSTEAAATLSTVSRVQALCPSALAAGASKPALQSLGLVQTFVSHPHPRNVTKELVQ